MNDVVLNKIQSIQRCVRRARDEYEADPEQFETDFTRQDAAVLNIVRACEQAIDLANYVIKSHKLGVPTSSGGSFELLRDEGVIDVTLADNMRRMVHFRNIVIHQYQSLDLRVVREVIQVHSDELVAFGDRVLAFSQRA